MCWMTRKDVDVYATFAKCALDPSTDGLCGYWLMSAFVMKWRVFSHLIANHLFFVCIELGSMLHIILVFLGNKVKINKGWVFLWLEILMLSAISISILFARWMIFSMLMKARVCTWWAETRASNTINYFVIFWDLIDLSAAIW